MKTLVKNYKAIWKYRTFDAHGYMGSVGMYRIASKVISSTVAQTVQ